MRLRPPTFRITKMLVAGFIASGFFVVRAGAQSRAVVPDSELTPFTRWSASAEAMRDSIVALAKRQLGRPYRRGASSPKRGFDCSGLVTYVMSHFDITLPRTARKQALVGQPLTRDLNVLKPGDLLTFGHGKRVSHVGIYIGGGQYVHAPIPGGKVREGSLLTGRIAGWWKGARRIIAVADTTTGSVGNASTD
jgi:cell wall-associated NlpC family hydrolase